MGGGGSFGECMMQTPDGMELEKRKSRKAEIGCAPQKRLEVEDRRERNRAIAREGHQVKNRTWWRA